MILPAVDDSPREFLRQSRGSTSEDCAPDCVMCGLTYHRWLSRTDEGRIRTRRNQREIRWNATTFNPAPRIASPWSRSRHPPEARTYSTSVPLSAGGGAGA